MPLPQAWWAGPWSGVRRPQVSQPTWRCRPPPSGHPDPAAPTGQPSAELRAILAEVDPARIRSTIETLVGFGTRHTLSSQNDPDRGIGAARRWIARQFRSYAQTSGGAMTVDVPSYVQQPTDRIPTPTRISSVRATLTGSSDPDRIYVVSGHYNSRVTDVQAMLTNDIVGSSTADDGTVDAHSLRLFAQGVANPETDADAARVQVGGENDSPARELARFVTEVATRPVTGMDVRVIYRLDRYLRGGDHLSFLEAGYPACRFTEPHEDFRHRHQDVRVEDGVQYGDLLAFCDIDFHRPRGQGQRR